MPVFRSGFPKLTKKISAVQAAHSTPIAPCPCGPIPSVGPLPRPKCDCPDVQLAEDRRARAAELSGETATRTRRDPTPAWKAAQRRSIECPGMPWSKERGCSKSLPGSAGASAGFLNCPSPSCSEATASPHFVLRVFGKATEPNLSGKAFLRRILPGPQETQRLNAKRRQ